MENLNEENYINIFNTVNTPEKNELTPPSSPKYKTNYNSDINEVSQFELNDNININSEKEIINEKRKINIFNFAEDDEEKPKDENENKNKIIIKEEKENNNDIFNDNRISFADELMKIKPLRISGNKPNNLINRKSAFPKNIINQILGNKNNIINSNKRKTLLFGSDFNKMKRISITNFNKLNKNKNSITHIKNNIKNFVKYDNVFLDNEFYLRAPGSFPDEDEANFLLKYNFLEENNYLEEENRASNDYINHQYIRQTNSISYNSHIGNKIQNKIMLNSLTFSKIEEEEDEKDKSEIKENKNIYIDEEEISGKNILYAENVKVNNNFVEGTFNKSLVTKENESKIAYISINLFIKKIALFNFRINYPLLYKAFLQQYNYFLSGTLFIEKIIQAFELYYNNNNKITNELINLLNIIISENYEKIKEDFILLEKLKKFYLYLKDFLFTEMESALEKEIDNIYFILFETDSDEEIQYSLNFVHERKKSNSIFIKKTKKNIYSNIFNKIQNEKNEIQNEKTQKKRKVLVKNKTTIGLRYFYIFSHTPMEIAQYLTCVSYNMMRNINQKELLNKNFIGKEKGTRAPNVMKLIDRFNKLVYFVIEDIFSYDDKKTRCQCIERWIEIAIKLKELHNFNDLVMVNACFVNMTMNKLKLTFKKLSNKYKNIIKELNAFCSSADCYINIRRLIFNSKGIPYIPYLGIILKEIINIEEMKYIIDENKINFSKVVKIYNVINRFNEFKKTKFSCEQSKELDILSNLNPKSEEELEELANKIEPKLKVFTTKGNKKRLTNTDKFYYYKKSSANKTLK